MIRFLALIAFSVLATLPSDVSAQVVRFRTNVGSFDMLLNPTGNDNLQPLVDNLLSYVETGRYTNAVINRASDGVAGDPTDDFVLQMGGFLTSQLNNVTANDLNQTPVRRFDSVTVDANNDGQADFNTNGLSNIRGAVSLALAGGDLNSGTSSFFVNINDNLGLDDQGFVPFAYIQDMETIDLIMALNQVSLDSGLTFSDIPLTEFNDLVFINSVDIISTVSTLDGPLGPAASTAIQRELLNNLTGDPVNPENVPDDFIASSSTSALLSATASSVPEPTTVAMLVAGSLMLLGRRHR